MAHGNSITRGFGASDPETTSYPPVLQGLLSAAQPLQDHVLLAGALACARAPEPDSHRARSSVSAQTTSYPQGLSTR